ncbi:glycosyltransferase family 2 protein [Halosolutus amylolyticus]|uniref:Glycosyltransferase family 2 protein n=1 Tax=Halosolutus amylolyticus TaxID=2932267 RepID=A0ABD5PQM8_9EURY|nr:glycosyltransferase family 2 protein [Halosolutus amylolyticus]
MSDDVPIPGPVPDVAGGSFSLDDLAAFAPNSSGDERILVGIPAYNEETTIGSVTLAARRYADDVVVADDGSTDRTAEIARAAGALVLRHPKNRGKGRAVRTLLRYAKSTACDVFVLLDGDGQHSPATIPDLVEPILSDDADLVIGSRYADRGTGKQTPRYRRAGQRTLDLLTSLSLGTDLTDTQSGFRALSTESIDELQLESDGYRVESEMINVASRRGLRIAEIPVFARYSGENDHSLDPVRHGISVVTYLLEILRNDRPVLFYGFPAMLLAGFALLYRVLCGGTDATSDETGRNASLRWRNRGASLQRHLQRGRSISAVGSGRRSTRHSNRRERHE